MTSEFCKRVAEHGKEGVLQKIVCTELGLSSRDGSRLAVRLEHHGTIRREKVLENKRWTYLLRPLRIPLDFRSIEQCPCLTCPYETKCSPLGVLSPFECPWLCEWVTKEFREREFLLSKKRDLPQSNERVSNTREAHDQLPH